MLSNEQLAALSKEYQETGNEEIFNRIYKETKGLIKATTYRYCKRRDYMGLWDDMYQEASIGFYQAVKKYKGENGAAFTTFAINCMKYNLLHYTRDSISLIKLPVKLRLTRIVPIPISLEQQHWDYEDRTMGEVIPDEIDLEGDIIEKVYAEQLAEYFKKDSHKQVFYYHHIQGLSLIDIAKIMGKHHSQISRWKREVNEILKGKVKVNG